MSTCENPRSNIYGHSGGCCRPEVRLQLIIPARVHHSRQLLLSSTTSLNYSHQVHLSARFINHLQQVPKTFGASLHVSLNSAEHSCQDISSKTPSAQRQTEHLQLPDAP